MVMWSLVRFRHNRVLAPLPRYSAALIVALACPVLALVATSRWLAPMPDREALELMRRLPSVAVGDLVALEWQEAASRASAGRELRSLLALLPERAPLMRAVGGGWFGTLPQGAGDLIATVNDRIAAGDSLQDDLPELRASLNELMRLQPGSVALQYTAANLELRGGNPHEALRGIERILNRLQDGAKLDALPPDEAAARAMSPDRVSALILCRYLAALAALRGAEAERGVAYLKLAIGHTNYLPAVHRDVDPRNFRIVPVLTRAPAVITPEEAAGFTTLTLYDTLLVGYLLAPGFTAPANLRGREFARDRLEHSRDDPFYRLVLASVPWPRDPWRSDPITSSTFGLPEHLTWACSNLQRLRLANAGAMPASHLAVEAATLLHIAARPELPGSKDGSVSRELLTGTARQRLIEAWQHAARSGGSPQVQHVLLTLSDVLQPADLEKFEPGTLEGLQSTVLGQDSPANLRAVRAAGELRTRLQNREIQVLDEVAAVLAKTPASISPLAAHFETDADRTWLQRWRAKALTAYTASVVGEAIARHDKQDTAGADRHLDLLHWVATRSGTSRLDAIERHATAVWPATDRRRVVEAWFQDHSLVTVATTFLLGVMAGLIVWGGFIWYCRFRALLGLCFYRRALP
jgi:hypothetical protein